ncbi:MAG: hypothetical protein M1833_001185 [Piccolia ochrophora]|nr:MAG: hypothetical protein M1833_001185 [Piccolia ochrophora]
MGSLDAKIVVLGAQGVGKTSLVNRYATNSFTPASTHSTVGASFITKRVFDDDSNTTVRLQIWDTAGQERFRSISKLYYRGADACILCYDLLDEESFKEMQQWLLELRDSVNESDNVVIEIVGTKCDLVQQDPALRKVSLETCIAFVAETLYPSRTSTPSTPEAHAPRSLTSQPGSDVWAQTCHEISARDGDGVDELFRVVVRKLVEQNAKKMERERGGNAALAATADGGPDKRRARATQRAGGSFRVGRDRRSWIDFPPRVDIDGGAADDADEVRDRRQRGRCC